MAYCGESVRSSCEGVRLQTKLIPKVMSKFAAFLPSCSKEQFFNLHLRYCEWLEKIYLLFFRMKMPLPVKFFRIPKFKSLSAWRSLTLIASGCGKSKWFQSAKSSCHKSTMTYHIVFYLTFQNQFTLKNTDKVTLNFL